MREGWEVKTLDELCEIARGGSPRPIKKYLTAAQDGVNWIKISDATASSKYIYKTKQKIKPDGVKRSRLVKEDDFILSNSMSFGRPYIMKTTGCIHDGWLVLRDKSGQFDQDYLYYFLGSSASYAQFDNLAAGSTVRNLNIDLAKSVQVMLPPLPEQKRIVVILDEAFAGIDTAIANTKKNLANARALFESYLNNVFTQKGEGWVEKTVGEIADHCLGKMLDKKKNKGTPKPYLRNLNVRWLNVDVDELLEMRFEQKEEDRYAAKKGDLLICEGGYPGRAAIWQSDSPIFFQKAIHRIRSKNQKHNRWLMYYLFLSNSKNDLRQYFTGAGIQHFTGQSLKRFMLPIAPPEEMTLHLKAFDSLYEQTQRLESIYQQKLTALTELKQSILQKAFTGELTADFAPRQLVN